MKLVPFGVVAVVVLIVGAPVASSSSQTSFNAISSAVNSAFVAVQTAGRDGGNVTSLVAQLNSALALVHKASSENTSDPAQASTDLQSALTIAQGVQSSAGVADKQGLSARQLQFELSITSAVAIVGVALALYLYGDRIYRRIWLRTYREQVVKKTG